MSSYIISRERLFGSQLTIDQINNARQKMSGMVWSIFDPEDDDIEYLDIGTDAPDGVYKVHFNGHTAWGVVVQDGKFDVFETAKAVRQARDSEGYWGEFIERLTYDPNTQIFDVTIGS